LRDIEYSHHDTASLSKDNLKNARSKRPRKLPNRHHRSIVARHRQVATDTLAACRPAATDVTRSIQRITPRPNVVGGMKLAKFRAELTKLSEEACKLRAETNKLNAERIKLDAGTSTLHAQVYARADCNPR
jgi:hypothetical protein